MISVLDTKICSPKLQLSNASMEYDPLYDEEKGSKVMPSSFHDISDVEFQDNWGRVWYDILSSPFHQFLLLLVDFLEFFVERFIVHVWIGWTSARLIFSQSTCFLTAWLYWARSKSRLSFFLHTTSFRSSSSSWYIWNCVVCLCRYLGIQQVVFGGRRMGDWEEGMTSPDFGYKSFKIWDIFYVL